MTVSKIATSTAPLGKMPNGKTNRFTARPGGVDMFIVHHAATISLSGLLHQYVKPGRELSSNYAIKDDQIVAILHEEYRPFTSSSPKADGRAVTVEVANSTGAPGWAVSAASFESLARLIADVATRHGFPIDRTHVIGHREVLGRFGQGISTACPGGLWPRMDELVKRARAIQGGAPGPTPTPPAPEKTAAQIEEEELMSASADIQKHAQEVANDTIAKLTNIIKAEVDARVAIAESRLRSEIRGYVYFDAGTDGHGTIEQAEHAVLIQAGGLILPLLSPAADDMRQIASLEISEDGMTYKWLDSTPRHTGLPTERFWNKVKDALIGRGQLDATIDTAKAIFAK